jgi:hypothetical protein
MGQLNGIGLNDISIKGPNDITNPSGINWSDIGLSDVGWMTKALAS